MILLSSYSTRLAALALTLVAVGLMLGACGTSDTDVGSSAQNTDGVDGQQTGGTADTAETGTDVDESVAVVTEPVLEEGSNVGQKVPAFYIRDSSATKITSEELFARGRPSFFYFFTTW